MQIRENVSLKALNTFGLEVSCRFYIQIRSTKALRDLFTGNNMPDGPHLILGGGSNLLFTEDFPGVIIHLCIPGIEVPGIETLRKMSVDLPKNHILVSANAGESWDGFVHYCVSHGWGGLENLSLIPGQVGTSPIQNIGAYGTELKDVFHSLEAMEKSSGRMVVFDREACKFGYRDSFFKREGKGRFVIVRVNFLLTTANHLVRTHYGSIQEELKKMGVDEPGIQEIRDAVVRIRTEKLPDPAKTGNAGSFFKNPVVSTNHFQDLKQSFPDIVGYPDPAGIKLAAGWLIEKAGWKGYRKGDAGVHHKQALVLVNYGHASGKDLVDLSCSISDSVKSLFQVDLETEVNII